MKIEVNGLGEALRTLNRVEPGLRSKMQRDLRKAIKPMVDAINAAVPAEAPLSGMNHNGRTGWNRRRAVYIKIDARRPRRGLSRPNHSMLGVVRISTRDPATAIADMAGKAGGNASRAPQVRRRPNFAQSLRGEPSRYMWPNAEQNFPQVEDNVRDIVQDIIFQANRELMKVHR